MLMAMTYCAHFAVFDCIIVFYINSGFVTKHCFKQNNQKMTLKFWTKTTLGINRNHKTYICMHSQVDYGASNTTSGPIFDALPPIAGR